MTGPMTVAGSFGSPVLRDVTLATNLAVNSSSTERSTRTRLAAMQTWPWWTYRLKTAASTA